GLCPLLRREYVSDLGACRIHDLLHARSVLRSEQVHLLLASLENLVDARLLLRAHAEALVVAGAVALAILALRLVRLCGGTTAGQLSGRAAAQPGNGTGRGEEQSPCKAQPARPACCHHRTSPISAISRSLTGGSRSSSRQS